MKIVVGNVKSRVITGGSDNLLGFDPMKELREYLRVRPKGYNQVDAYKRHVWDGYKYFITPKGEFATGFLPYILTYLTDLGVGIELLDERGDIKELHQLGGKLDNGWDLYDYQLEAISKVNNHITWADQSLYFPRGIIDAATNAGKNSIIAGIYNNMPYNTRLIMLIHNQTIFKQAVEFFGSMFDVGQVKSGMYKIAPFTIAMNKTLYNRAKESDNVKRDLTTFDIMITDESHRAGSSEYAALLQMITSPIRILVSGTPLDNDDKVSNMVTVGLSGPVLYKVENKTVIEKGYSQKPKIKIYLNRTIPSSPLLTYREELEECVFYSDYRNKSIATLVEERNGNSILIAYNEIAHGEEIYDNLKDLPYRVEITHSKDKERDSKIELFKNGEIDVLLVSGILKEGANIPVIRTLINAQSGKSKITVKQFVGRALRHDGENDEVEIIDFYDLGRYLSKHSRDRINIYKKEEFDIEFLYEANWRGKPKDFMQY